MRIGLNLRFTKRLQLELEITPASLYVRLGRTRAMHLELREWNGWKPTRDSGRMGTEFSWGFWRGAANR